MRNANTRQNTTPFGRGSTAAPLTERRMREMETNNSRDISEAKWRDLVGGFILAFGEIEFITYRLWNDLFPDQKPPDKFRPRTNQILDRLKALPEINQAVFQLLTDAVALAEKRNIVAHNPIGTGVPAHTYRSNHD